MCRGRLPREMVERRVAIVKVIVEIAHHFNVQSEWRQIILMCNLALLPSDISVIGLPWPKMSLCQKQFGPTDSTRRRRLFALLQRPLRNSERRQSNQVSAKLLTLNRR